MRFGHTVLPNFIRRIQEDGFDETFLLGEMFFRTSMVEIDGGVDTWLKVRTTSSLNGNTFLWNTLLYF